MSVVDQAVSCARAGKVSSITGAWPPALLPY